MFRFLLTGFFLMSISIATGADTKAPETKIAKEGDAAPDIALPATQISKVLPDSKEKTLSLASFKGKKNVVLFYFPKAMTPGCTVESCGFRDALEKFAGTDTVVIGFSSDKLEAQEKFTEKEKLTYPLLADSEKKLMSALGTSKRITYVINKEGKIVKIYDKVTVKTHPEEVFEFVKTLKK